MRLIQTGATRREIVRHAEAHVEPGEQVKLVVYGVEEARSLFLLLLIVLAGLPGIAIGLALGAEAGAQVGFAVGTVAGLLLGVAFGALRAHLIAATGDALYVFEPGWTSMQVKRLRAKYALDSISLALNWRILRLGRPHGPRLLQLSMWRAFDGRGKAMGSRGVRRLLDADTAL